MRRLLGMRRGWDLGLGARRTDMAAHGFAQRQEHVFAMLHDLLATFVFLASRFGVGFEFPNVDS